MTSHAPLTRLVCPDLLSQSITRVVMIGTATWYLFSGREGVTSLREAAEADSGTRPRSRLYGFSAETGDATQFRLSWLLQRGAPTEDEPGTVTGSAGSRRARALLRRAPAGYSYACFQSCVAAVLLWRCSIVWTTMKSGRRFCHCVALAHLDCRRTPAEGQRGWGGTTPSLWAGGVHGMRLWNSFRIYAHSSCSVRLSILAYPRATSRFPLSLGTTLRAEKPQQTLSMHSKAQCGRISPWTARASFQNRQRACKHGGRGLSPSLLAHPPPLSLASLSLSTCKGPRYWAETRPAAPAVVVKSAMLCASEQHVTPLPFFLPLQPCTATLL